MTRADWLIGLLVTFFGVVSVLLFVVAFGVGNRKREREELRRSAERAQQVRK